MPLADEKTIIDSVKKGDRNAFCAIVETYKAAVFNLSFRMTGSIEDAEDIAQETFLRAYRHLYRYDTQKPFFTWLYTICLNCTRNHLKRKKNLIKIIPDYSNDDRDRTPEKRLQQKMEAQSIQNLLFRLHGKYREAIVLRYYQDLSFKEMGAVLRISESAAKMRVYRGLERMKLLLDFR